ncbi:hypothetical protein HII12_004520 [Brettanomyces bruxellensis]|uniref:LDB19 N-terminal domain-containing protein n=1 Tax=Dekkera bruxellensis TaxID=5007 RepID=A0A8H6ERG6_DEKBR|nr:hypothetical protein HII12_004520 [Brettanomyces bruxellensis]
MPSFSRLFNGIVHAVSTEDSSGKRRYGGRSSASIDTESETDEYHTVKCNRLNPNSDIRISLCVESPPIMLYGKPAESSGALFNGALVLDVFARNSKDIRELLESRSGTAANSMPVSPVMPPATPDGLGPTASVGQLSRQQLRRGYVELRQVKLYFLQVVRYSKPFLPHSSSLQHCGACRRKVTELASWDVLSRRTAFAKGTSHSFPFGYLIPGKVPPTTVLSTHGTSITYELVCKAVFINRRGAEDLINLSLPVMIRRSIFRGHDHNSLRIFPPTDVTATAAIPNISYPRSTFPVEIRMDNIATKDRRWRMRKLSWKIEESVRVRAHHCVQHEKKFRTALEVARKKVRGRKFNRNSNGANGPAYNYFIGNFDDADSGRSNSSESTGSSVGSSSNAATSNTATNVANAGSSVANVANAGSSSNAATNTNATTNTPIAASIVSPSHPQDPPNATQPSNSHSQRLVHNASSGVASIVSPDSSATPTLSPFASNWSIDASPAQVSAGIDEAVQASRQDELYTEEIRLLSSGEMKSGWKSDFSNKGRIELVVDVSTMELMSMGFNSANTNITTITSENCNSPLFDPATYLEADSNCSCDISDPELGIYVNHNLIVEAIVAEELVQSSTSLKVGRLGSSASQRASESVSGPETASRPLEIHDGGTGPDSMRGNRQDYANQTSGIPTGVARVLRMQFKVVLTERSGLGVSWDDEVPPTYNAVHTLSPPTYEEATSNNNTPLLSSLVIPLDHEVSPGSDAESVSINAQVSNPEVPRHARVRNRGQVGNSSNIHLRTTPSHLDLGS